MPTAPKCAQWLTVAVVALSVLLVGCSRTTPGGSAVAPTPPIEPTAATAPQAGGPGEALTADSPVPVTAAAQAIARAAEGGRYAFVLFHRSGGPSADPMQAPFSQAKADLQSKAEFTTVDVDKDADAQLIDKYGIDRAPLPVILALAPNGAVTKAFTKPADAAALRKAFVSETTARMLKALQDGKLVALCVQGDNTQHNQESMDAAREFAADESLEGQAEVMRLDPGSRGEAPLLEQCNLSPTLREASIVLLVPPNTLVATVPGATTKAKLLSALQQGLAACGSGCGPSGCG